MGGLRNGGDLLRFEVTPEAIETAVPCLKALGLFTRNMKPSQLRQIYLERQEFSSRQADCLAGLAVHAALAHFKGVIALMRRLAKPFGQLGGLRGSSLRCWLGRFLHWFL